MRLFVVLVGIFYLLPIASGPLAVQAAEITPEQNAKNRMTYAGRQRMLTQQIARNACFVMAGIDPERYAGKTDANVRRFNTVLIALRHGDDTLGILPEEFDDVLETLAVVEDHWRALGPAAFQIAAGDYLSVPMQQLLSLNMTALKDMHFAVEMMKKHYDDKNMSPELQHTVALAGRQRMLSQKVSKEVCFASLGITLSGNQNLVGETIAQFDSAMAALIEGSPSNGVLQPPNRQVKIQLDRANRAWNDLKELILEIDGDTDVDQGSRVKLANLSDQVLREMDLAVVLYTQ